MIYLSKSYQQYNILTLQYEILTDYTQILDIFLYNFIFKIWKIRILKPGLAPITYDSAFYM